MSAARFQTDTDYPRVNACVVQASELFPASLATQERSLHAENIEYSVTKQIAKLRPQVCGFWVIFKFVKDLLRELWAPVESSHILVDELHLKVFFLCPGPIEVEQKPKGVERLRRVEQAPLRWVCCPRSALPNTEALPPWSQCWPRRPQRMWFRSKLIKSPLVC